MQENREQKQGYEAFRSFQASVGNDYRSRPSYNPPPRQSQPVQPNLAYREGRKADRNAAYTNRDSNSTSARSVYTPQDARASQDFTYNRPTGPLPFNPATSRNPYVNGSSQYMYQWGNPLCYKCGVPGHTAPECYSDTPLSRAESTHLRNLYQRPVSNREPDFPIPNQAQGSQGFPRDQQRSNNNPVTAQSNSVIAETMRPVSQHPSCGQRYEATRNDFKRVIHYNDDSDSDKEVEFIDVYLPCNKLSLQLLANDVTTRSKKRRVDDIEDETTKAHKTNTAREKKVPVKRVGKKSSKASVPISRLVKHPASDV